MKLTELLAIVNEELGFNGGHYAKELHELLKQCEYPGFTLAQACYWQGNLNHSGQFSKGYKFLCCGYKPSLTESPESLIEIDYEFERIYNHLESRVQAGLLTL